jgi:hypothetical protein
VIDRIAEKWQQATEAFEKCSGYLSFAEHEKIADYMLAIVRILI